MARQQTLSRFNTPPALVFPVLKESLVKFPTPRTPEQAAAAAAWVKAEIKRREEERRP